MGARRRLEAMLEAGDLVAGKGFLGLKPEFPEHPVGRTLVMLELELAQEEVLFLAAILHLGKIDRLHRGASFKCRPILSEPLWRLNMPAKFRQFTGALPSL